MGLMIHSHDQGLVGFWLVRSAESGSRGLGLRVDQGDLGRVCIGLRVDQGDLC